MSTGYPASTITNRISRRRALAAGGGLSAALFLAACGGDDKSSGAKEPASSLVQSAQDTSKDAKRGGTLVRSFNSDFRSFDPYIPAAQTTGLVPYVFSRLLAYKPGVGGPADGMLGPDLAESWEWAPDGLSLTLKLRQGVKFHPIAPVNGRVLTMDDVMFSINRQFTIGAQRSVYNPAVPTGPILSVTPTDSRTIVYKLKSPMVFLADMLAASTSGHLHILPKEAEASYDIEHRVISTGPFMLKEEDYVPSASFTVRRHPDYYDKERPYLDAVKYPIITEYATAFSQFKAGAIHSPAAAIPRASDMLQLKRDEPRILMYQTDVTDLGYVLCFGYVPGSPFNDERVRQAYSMAFDRDLFLDVQFNVTKFRQDGLPVDSAWSSLFPVDMFKGWWLDPQGKDFGPNAKYYKHDVAEAKKLLTAAGHPSGVTYKSNYFTTNDLGPDFPKNVEVTEGMVADAGFKAEKNIVTVSDYLSPRFLFAKGKFEGVIYRRGPGPLSTDAAGWLNFLFYSKGDAFLGFDPNGKGDNSGDPSLDAQILKVMGEFDANKRRELANEIQRYAAGKMYMMRWAGGASSFSMAWPAVKNWTAFHGGGGLWPFTLPVPNYYEWLDPSQPPLKTS